MPPEPKRQAQKRRTREAILAAARRVIARRGFEGMTTREVAEEAGVAAGTVFVHFPDVAALAEALLDEHIGAALEAAYRTLPPRGDVIHRLLHVAEKLYASYDVEPVLSRQTLAASLFRHDPTGPAATRRAEFEQWVAAEIAEAVSRGSLPPIDLRVAFAAFFSLYFGALVAGLRKEIDRETQLGLLEASLRQLFRMENES
jgi:AcrR family transcriptional regulator